MPPATVHRSDFLAEFRAACAARSVVPDEAQLATARRLARLYDELVEFKHARRNKLRKILVHPPLPRGLYLWGGVGRGKSLLMNLFYEALPYRRKRRIHFHAFMQEVHRDLKRFKFEEDPLVKVAAHIAREVRFMCLDEFHVSDIADAMILKRLFEQLFERVVFCVTSNYPPDGLYPGGLQRANFLPAIRLLKAKLDVMEVDGGVDYRLRALERIRAYHVPADAQSDRLLAETFREMSGGGGNARAIEILGREIPVRKRTMGVIWFDFDALCGGPRSQNDYLELARNYHTVLLSHVRHMGIEQAAEARRFTWLVDVLYDHGVKLIATADCEPEGLYREGPNAHEFPRTVSRLIEMRTREYLALPHRAD
jgi:cell division protein ZapE